MGVKQKTHENLAEYLLRARSMAKSVILRNGAKLSDFLVIKQWRYIGHCVRNHVFPELQKLMRFRDKN
eukprot:3301863-Karenia_brevis.AAC.1